MVAAAFAGYPAARLLLSARVMFGVAGPASLVPIGAFAGAGSAGTAGFVDGLAPIAHSLYCGSGTTSPRAAE